MQPRWMPSRGEGWVGASCPLPRHLLACPAPHCDKVEGSSRQRDAQSCATEREGDEPVSQQAVRTNLRLGRKPELLGVELVVKKG